MLEKECIQRQFANVDKKIGEQDQKQVSSYRYKTIRDSTYGPGVIGLPKNLLALQ